MYSLSDFGRMIADETRRDAYARALRASVNRDSVVIDIGAGTGILSLLACQCGARKVYAIEPSDAIKVAEEIATANGLADRIEFIQATSNSVSLRERADVIVSDLRGVLPLYEQHLPTIIDARARFLTPHGVLIPQRDSLWASVVDASRVYDRLVAPWANTFSGFNMDAARSLVTNAWEKASVAREQLLSEPCCLSTIDYSTVESPDVSANMIAPVLRQGVAHGLIVWFDSVLYEGIGFSNAPGQPELIYGTGFFPFPSSVELEAGDTVSVSLRADLIGLDYVWTWETTVQRSESTPAIARFHQSSFMGTPLSAGRLHKRSNEYKPLLTKDGQVDLFILQAMDGDTALEQIARALMTRFPGRFESEKKASARVADLSEKYSGM
jgi:protein arginine N-methyltransferase 1